MQTVEYRDVFLPLESLQWKLVEEKARQSDWSAKCNIDNNMLFSKNRSNRKKQRQAAVHVTVKKRKQINSTVNALIVVKMAI